LIERTVLATYPGEYLPDNLRLLFDDLVTRGSSARVLIHVPVAERRLRQDTDPTAARCVQTPTPRAFQNFGPLVFANDPLDLQQQLILRRRSHRPVKEHDFHATGLQFFDQYHLVGMASRQTIRCQHIETINGSRSGLVTQSFQGRPNQRAAADTVIDKC
jgi:hypothetical protein